MDHHAYMNRYIIVSGVPAAGKSTVALGLATRCSLPILDKDVFLEALFSDGAPRDLAERRALSKRADLQLESAVRKSLGAIVVSWWRHPRSTADSGTPIEWLLELSGRLTEVYCECSPEIAAARFCSRTRHAGHMDARSSRAELLVQFTEATRLGPLRVGALVRVNSENPIDYDELCERVRRVSEQSK